MVCVITSSSLLLPFPPLSVPQVVVNGQDFQPASASPNKKHAKAMAATVALQAMGEVAGDTGLYTGPVFTTATTGPLFSSNV